MLKRSMPVLLVLCAFGVFSASALAEPGPGWMLTANDYPTALPPGGEGTLLINVMNIGAGASSGAITVTDTLPPGVTAEEAGDQDGFEFLEISLHGLAKIGHSYWHCTGGAGGPVAGASVIQCTNAESLSSIAGGGGNPGVAKGTDPVPQIAITVKTPDAKSLPGGEATEAN